MSETWKPVLGFKNYEVSDLGRVRSLDRWSRGKGGSSVLHKGRVLHPGKNNTGYLHVALHEDGESRTFLVSRLVAAAFCKPTGGDEVNHINRDRADNRASNLEWVTRKENLAHSKRAGMYDAITNPRMARRLTASKVDTIRKMWAGGMTNREISKIFGVHEVTIGEVVKGRTWNVERVLR